MKPSVVRVTFPGAPVTPLQATAEAVAALPVIEISQEPEAPVPVLVTV